MAIDIARRLVRKASGPAATVYCCPFCNYSERFRNGIRGVGRGHGLRMGGTLHPKVAAHIRAAHPCQLERATHALAKPRSFKFAGEAQRSDAMSEARALARELIEVTRGCWTFHYHAPSESYQVWESSK
jgi:hypothetical protein